MYVHHDPFWFSPKQLEICMIGVYSPGEHQFGWEGLINI